MEIKENEIMEIFRRVKSEVSKEKRIPEEMKVLMHGMRVTGYGNGEIAAMLGMREEAVRNIINDPMFRNGRLSELYRKVEEGLKDRVMGIASGILSGISDEDMKKASLLQKVTASAVLIDKGRLLGGKSTSNIGVAYEMMGARKPVEDSELRRLGEELGYGG